MLLSRGASAINASAAGSRSQISEYNQRAGGCVLSSVSPAMKSASGSRNFSAVTLRPNGVPQKTRLRVRRFRRSNLFSVSVQDLFRVFTAGLLNRWHSLPTSSCDELQMQPLKWLEDTVAYHILWQ